MQRFPLTTVQIQAPIVFAIGMMFGAIFYFLVEFEPSFWGLFCLASASVVAIIVAIRRSAPSWTVYLLWALVGGACGALSGSLATHRSQHVAVPTEIGPVLLEGWVQAALPAARGTRLRIRVHAIDGVEEDQTPPVVRVTHITRLETEPGRFVRCWVVLRPPPAPIIRGDYAFDRQAWYSGLGAVGYVQGRCRGGAVGGPKNAARAVMLEISKARRQLAQHVSEAAGARSGGFAAALTSGDRSFMSQADQEALRGAGLAHLLAISGLHMGIVGGLVFLLAWRGLALVEPVALRLNVKKIGAIAALLACATYLVLSGASVSTQRAFVMAAILFGAVLIDRSALSLRSLAIAMVIILSVAPWSALTPGFQMSFAATGALVATYERWNKRRKAALGARSGRIMFWIKSLVVTSTVSSFATLPFALYHFERAAPLGLLANLFAMPIVTLIAAPMAAAALLLTPFGLDHIALGLFGISLSLVLEIAHFFSAWDLEAIYSVPRLPPLSFAALAGGVLAFCLTSSARTAWFAAILSGIIALGVWSQAGIDKIHFAPSGDVFLEHASGQIERIAWRDGQGLGPLRFSDLVVDRDCEEAPKCEIAFAGYNIRLRTPSDVIEMRPISANDASVTIKWPDIERENGITLVRHGGRFEKQRKPDCGSRAWRICGESEKP
ncbi:MAG: ComEC/Rec2 family competence protein [Henriciella sp.]